VEMSQGQLALAGQRRSVSKPPDSRNCLVFGSARHYTESMTIGLESDRERRRITRRRAWAGLLAATGYILSPLSWYNDLLVNIPLAYLIAWPFARIDSRLYAPAFVVAYWLTNIVGLALVHRGTAGLIDSTRPRLWVTRKSVSDDILIALIYTAIIISLIATGVLRPPQPV